MYVCMYVCIYVCTYVYMYACASLCVRACVVIVYLCKGHKRKRAFSIPSHTHTHTHTHTSSLPRSYQRACNAQNNNHAPAHPRMRIPKHPSTHAPKKHTQSHQRGRAMRAWRGYFRRSGQPRQVMARSRAREGLALGGSACMASMFANVRRLGRVRLSVT